jgi:NADH-quinone oxidoreductase subunit D
MTNNFAYALSVEKLAKIDVPERAQYIRVMMAELTRLLNHSILVGFLLNDMGAFFTPILYAFREREKILDLFEAVSGSRMMCNYFRFGGVRADLPDGFLSKVTEISANFPRFLDEFERFLSDNDILKSRCQNVGVISKELAVNASLSGPILRASGVNYDIRKVDKYSIYDRFDFKVPLGSRGDTYDRYFVRILEMRESVKILKQVIRDIPKEGDILSDAGRRANKAPRMWKVPEGDAYGRIESPKGELGFYLVSDGSARPYRYHVRPPSFINLTALEDMCIGEKVADVMVNLGSIDIVLGEVDR